VEVEVTEAFGRQDDDRHDGPVDTHLAEWANQSRSASDEGGSEHDEWYQNPALRE
jgi:hypothetical protein